MNREQLARELKKYAEEKLNILRSFENAKQEFVVARAAYRAMTGEDITGAEGVAGISRGNWARGGPPGIAEGGQRAKKGVITASILRLLLTHKDGLRPVEIADLLKTKYGNLGKSMLRMKDAGYVMSKNHYYFITPAGKTHLAETIERLAISEPEEKKSYKKNPDAPPIARRKPTGDVSTPLVLRVLREMGNAGGTPKEVASALGVNGDRDGYKRLGVILPYVRSQKFATSERDPKRGVVYYITEAGQAKADKPDK